MLKRARISAEIAIVAAFFGFSGIMQTTAGIAQTVFYCLMAFSALSLLLCLFEEKPEQLETKAIRTQPTQANHTQMSTQALPS